MPYPFPIRHYYLPWLAGLLVMAFVLLMPPDQLATVPYAPLVLSPQEFTSVIPEVIEPVVITMPFFPGCQSFKGKDKRACSSKRMYAYIYDQASYPVGNPTQRTAGIVEVEFLVGSDGLIRNPKLKRGPGHGRGGDALRIINNMIAEGICWEPATAGGEPIRTQMAITIQYNMVWAGARPQP
ncbi:energy transducer TonB [Neolewinella persica]|uniref:energy transducer TonB n=1 Tax=Neolewinella persica TaxID=70998 RepID=UPI0004759393|nr:energy transducer TonB [Neolewinella persica]